MYNEMIAASFRSCRAVFERTLHGRAEVNIRDFVLTWVGLDLELLERTKLCICATLQGVADGFIVGA